MQTKMQNFVKLIFLALVFGSLVGCGSDDDDGTTGFVGNITGNNSNNTTVPISNNTTTTSSTPAISSYYALESDVFPDLRGHIFGPFWDSASVETHTVKYSLSTEAEALAYEDEVRDEFPDILQIGFSGGYHNVAYYKGNFIGDASVSIVKGAKDYTVTQSIDIILPIPVFVADIDSGVFTSGAIFPEFDGDAPIKEIVTKINYGYFGSPNLQTYKIALSAAGFKPENGRVDDNVWVLKKGGLVYTFEHDNPWLDATLIPFINVFDNFSLINKYIGSVGGFINHWVTNWVNVNKYALWKISVE
jgi:hypothetical protein